MISGAQALQYGIVQWAVPNQDLSNRALASRATSLRCLAAALAEAKACIGAADGYERELEATLKLSADETQSRVRAFLEKRR